MANNVSNEEIAERIEYLVKQRGMAQCLTNRYKEVNTMLADHLNMYASEIVAALRDTRISDLSNRYLWTELDMINLIQHLGKKTTEGYNVLQLANIISDLPVSIEGPSLDEAWFVIEIHKHIANSGLADPDPEEILTTRISIEANWNHEIRNYKGWSVVSDSETINSRRLELKNGDSEITFILREATDADLEG